MNNTELIADEREEQLSRLRALYAEWGETKRALDAIHQQIDVLEFDMGYTTHVGGPWLTKRSA